MKDAGAGPRQRWGCGSLDWGVVAEAKRAGLVDLVKPVLDDLIRNARFWIGPEIYGEVLAELGEA